MKTEKTNQQPLQLLTAYGETIKVNYHHWEENKQPHKAELERFSDQV